MDIAWGIIGCGNVTEVKSGPAFSKVPGSRLVAVMRRNGDKAKDYALRHGVPKWFDNAQTLIDDKDVNAIYIATPPSSHEEYAIRCLNAGKPVYLEKPMALHAASAERIAAAAKKKGVKISIAHYRRQQPRFLQIREWLNEEIVGKVETVDLQFQQPCHIPVIAQTEEAWRLNPDVSGGGLFHDLAPHQLDLLLYFFGTPLRVSGKATNVSGLYSVPDAIDADMAFPGGIRFRGAWRFTASVNEDQCVINGSQGSIRFAVFGNDPVEIFRKGKMETVPFNQLQHVQQPMIQQVVAYFKGMVENPCAAEEGTEVMRMIDAITSK